MPVAGEGAGGSDSGSPPGGEPTTFPALLGRNAARHGDKAAIVTEDDRLSHAELDHRSAVVAGGLVAAGVAKGARVGLLAPNGVEWAVAAAAVMRVGGVLVPLSTLLRPPELAAQLATADVSHLIVAPTFRGRAYLDDLDTVAPGITSDTAAGRRHRALPCLQRVWRLDQLPDGDGDPLLVAGLAEAVRPGDDLAVLFTSGSRGVPKGTIHTHDGLLHAVGASLDARGLGPDDRLYVPMPFFWTGGFCTGLLSALVAGATLLTEAVPEPGRTLELLQRERVTLFRGWPDQAARLAADPRFPAEGLPGLGDASLPALLPPERRPAPGARPNIFGMTETAGPHTGAPLDRDLPDAERGSCGRPFAGIELRVTDPDTGAELRAGEVGEVRVRGRNVMRAICGRPRHETFDADGFYRTGDLGAVDTEGYLWFHGRLDDMFKVRGATVYPTEVEAALRALPGVQQAHVTEVPHDRPGSDADLGAGRDRGGGPLPGQGGEVGALVVSTRPASELRAEAAERLSAFKVPTLWLVTSSADDVPVTATAKVDKAALQERLRREGRTVSGSASTTAGLSGPVDQQEGSSA